ncbi:hypothetical protein JXB12_01210 [candidate division KSB1 bacterium]|nr:hypothetical protein [candidate division KSB1 bacterium]
MESKIQSFAHYMVNFLHRIETASGGIGSSYLRRGIRRAQHFQEYKEAT